MRVTVPTPSGKLTVPFSSLVQDTVKTHGLSWAARYYAKRGLPLWQFLVFAGIKTRKGLS